MSNWQLWITWPRICWDMLPTRNVEAHTGSTEFGWLGINILEIWLAKLKNFGFVPENGENSVCLCMAQNCERTKLPDFWCWASFWPQRIPPNRWNQRPVNFVWALKTQDPLAVEPPKMKNMRKSNWIMSPRIGVKTKNLKIIETTTAVNGFLLKSTNLDISTGFAGVLLWVDTPEIIKNQSKSLSTWLTLATTSAVRQWWVKDSTGSKWLPNLQGKSSKYILVTDCWPNIKSLLDFVVWD